MKEVCGQAPYEKRMIELLKVQKDKRAREVCQEEGKRVCVHDDGLITPLSH